MNSVLKAIAIVFAVVISVILAGIGYIFLALDPNDYKPEIEQAAQQAGVELDIKGDLTWSLYPAIGISINDLSFSHAMADGQLVSAGLSVELIPLFSSQVKVNSLAITGADITVREVTDSASTTAQTNDSATSQSVSLSVNSLSLSDSRIHYIAKAGDAIEINNIQLSTENLDLQGGLFPFSVSFDTIMAPAQLRLSSEGRIALSEQLKRVQLDQFIANGEWLDDSSEGLGNHLFNIAANAIIDLEKGEYQVDNFSLNVDDINISGEIEPIENGSRGSVNIAEFNLKTLLQRWNIAPPFTSSEDALSSVKISTEFEYLSQGIIKLPKLTVDLDGTPINLELQANTADKSVNAAIKAATLNLAAYLPPSEAEKADNDNIPAPLLSPLATLTKTLPGKSRYSIDIGEVMLNGMALKQVNAVLTTANGKVNIENLSTGIFGGKAKLSGVVQPALAVPTLQLKTTLTNLDLGVAADIEGLSGNASLEFSGISKGDLMDELLANMDGTGTITLANLGYQAFNLEKTYCEMAVMVEQQALASTGITWPEGTRFDDATGNITFKDNKVQLSQMDTGTGNLRVRASGNVNLGKQQLELLAGTKLVGEKTSETGCEVKNKRLKNTEVPLRCKGSYATDGEISCGADSKFLRDFAKDAVVDKLSDKLFGEPKEGETNEKKEAVKGLLKGLFGGKKDE